MTRFTCFSALVLLFLLPTVQIPAQDSKTIEGVLPKDVHPDSRNRLPLIQRGDLDERGKKAYDAAMENLAGSPGVGQIMRLHGNPASNIQMESPAGQPLMQLAIITTAREHDQPYEWSLHEMQAIAVGLDPAVIDVVRLRKPLTKVSDKEAVVIQMGREIFGAHKLGSETYARALGLLGRSNLVDVAGLMADYSRTSAALTAFNQQMPPGWKQFLPLPFTPPNDIHLDSRSRLPLIKSAATGVAPVLYGRSLAPEGTGPGQIRRHGAGLKSLEASVGRSTIDLAILVTAREHDAQYDWTVNELAAVKDGLAPAVIDVIRNRKGVVGLAEKDACLIEFGRELFGKHNVSSETYSRAVKVFGERDLVDLVDVMGEHSREAALLAAFDQHLPRGQKPLLPIAGSVVAAQAQPTRYPKPTELPNPYRLVEGWPTLPKTMNGGRWGEVIRVHVASDGNIWVFHRCFNTVPPGHATCIGRGDSNPPILEFDPSGKLLKSFGVGLFAYPHGFTIDGHGNLWVSDVNDEATVLGMSAKNADGVVRGQEVLKLSPSGKVLMMIGKEGVSGNGPDTFDRPTGVAVAPNGDVFVTDGHMPNQHNSARVVKFSKAGQFIKTWGHKGAAPGDFDEPHDIFIGGSQGRVYIADRRNNRIQVFDQDGNFIAAWKQFGQPSSVFVGKDDTIYVGASFPDPAAKKGELRGIVVGSAKDGSLQAFIPDPADPDKLDVGTSASGIAADDAGSIYAADVAAHNLRKYVKVK